MNNNTILVVGAVVIVAILLGVMVTRSKNSRTVTDLAELCEPLGLTPVTAKYAPPACVGTMKGARVAVVTGAKDTPSMHILSTTVLLYVETNSKKLPSEGTLPQGVAAREGKNIFKGSGLDLAIRSKWPEGWANVYLVGAPEGGVTTEGLKAGFEKLLKI